MQKKPDGETRGRYLFFDRLLVSWLHTLLFSAFFFCFLFCFLLCFLLCFSLVSFFVCLLSLLALYFLFLLSLLMALCIQPNVPCSLFFLFSFSFYTSLRVSGCRPANGDSGKKSGPAIPFGKSSSFPNHFAFYCYYAKNEVCFLYFIKTRRLSRYLITN